MSTESRARRLLLLRHGQTAWNAELRAQGHADVELDETGHLQAKRVAPVLASYRPTVLWSSDLARARQTAEHVGTACGLTPVLDARLREYAVGDNRMGLTFAEYAAAHSDEHAHLLAGRTHLVPGRETTEDVLGRFVPALHDLVAALGAGETGLVVAHGAALRVSVLAFLGLLPDVEPTLAGLDNTGWVELEESASTWDGEQVRWRLRAWNRVASPDFASGQGVG